jgi:hypothetical protein
MNTPYNTGKVQIGKYYQKPYYVEQDDDMLAIQGWLIGDNKQARRERIADLIYCCVLAITVFLSIFCTLD